MIRVVAGKYKRRTLKQPSLETTRATKDVAKEGLFSSLGNKVEGSVFLDLFSGSGAMGIEAISRGALKVYFNDVNKEPYKVINENIKTLGIDNAYVTNLDYKKALSFYIKSHVKFDIIFLDPPYKMIVNKEFIDEILKANILNENGIIVIETDYAIDLNIVELYNVKVLKYGRSLMNIIKGF